MYQQVEEEGPMMRRGIAMFILAMAILFLPTLAGAVEVNAGAAAWYAWWRPSFLDALTNRATKLTDRATGPVRFTPDPSVLIGPAVSVSFGGRWNVSAVFLYGAWYHISASVILQKTGENPVLREIDMYTRKWDLDSLVSYSLFGYLKVFVGVKWQGYRYCFRMMDSENTNPDRGNLRNNGVGPGLGIALTLPLGGDFFLLWNVSALYLYTMLDFGQPMNHREVYGALGGNTTLSVAWHVTSANTTVTLGFRYQYLSYRLLAGESDNISTNANGNANMVRDILTVDHFYGIMLSAVYSFSL
jgi:hypothetical protein